MSLTIVIIGGYGAFGGRLVELLDQDDRLTLIIAGRSYEKARDYCYKRLRSRAKLRYARFDRDGDVKAALEDLKPDIVVDCSGPFQNYGNAPYRVLEAAIELGIGYLDLADSSDFVAGVAAFDEAAKEKNAFALSGASTAPALTAAAVRALSTGITEIETISAGIAPSPRARVGESVIRAIASYAGKPVKLRRGGVEVSAYPFNEQRRFAIAPPGRIPLGDRLFSFVDVPDLRILPELWPSVREVWMGAAPVPEILHRMLIALAWCVRIDALARLTMFAPLMLWATNTFRWGEHRGGMFVAVEGRDVNGAARKRSWHLLAEGDDGPLIPSMAAASIVQKSLGGARPASGARAAAHDLELSDYAEIIGERRITWGFRDEVAPEAPLYQRLLGSAWDDLPEQIRALHLSSGASGRARVERGNPLAGVIADIIGFPKAGADIPLSVRFDRSDGSEIWTRSFGGKSFFSTESAGEGREQHLLTERFGPLAFAMALVVEDGKLRLPVRRWRAFGIPLPLWLGPRSEAYESVDANGRFNFHVSIQHPLIGLIIRYIGWLEPDK